MKRGITMQPNPADLLSVAGITNPLIGFYDTPEIDAFGPFIEANQCIYSCYQGWMRGESICLSEDSLKNLQCPGAGYWSCNVASAPREQVAQHLAMEQGLKASTDLMCEWLEVHPPYQKEHAYVVIGPLQKDSYEYLKTITFFANPDQLSLLITGAEYLNASNDYHPVSAVYGSGCGQLAAVFGDLDFPAATIGGTDIAMRAFMPGSILAFTVTKPMFEQLCALDENSFLHKSFWRNLRQARAQAGNAA
jgi:hypothetical protein